jgi:hypothetical protein
MKIYCCGQYQKNLEEKNGVLFMVAVDILPNEALFYEQYLNYFELSHLKG